MWLALNTSHSISPFLQLSESVLGIETGSGAEFGPDGAPGWSCGAEFGLDWDPSWSLGCVCVILIDRVSFRCRFLLIKFCSMGVSTI